MGYMKDGRGSQQKTDRSRGQADTVRCIGTASWVVKYSELGGVMHSVHAMRSFRAQVPKEHV